MSRMGQVSRQTRETDVHVQWLLDGKGQSHVETGIGFFDHLLELFARHSLTDLDVRAKGDLHVDGHHTVEDVGICMGSALQIALGDKRGIRRYGHGVLPMDETLVTAALDLSGRPYLHFDAEFPTARIGELDTELIAEFFRSFTNQAACNLHLIVHHGRNGHHLAEALFKATARTLRTAIEIDPRDKDSIPSTKGSL